MWHRVFFHFQLLLLCICKEKCDEKVAQNVFLPFHMSWWYWQQTVRVRNKLMLDWTWSIWGIVLLEAMTEWIDLFVLKNRTRVNQNWRKYYKDQRQISELVFVERNDENCDCKEMDVIYRNVSREFEFCINAKVYAINSTSIWALLSRS